jgi:hypothetical protein
VDTPRRALLPCPKAICGDEIVPEIPAPIVDHDTAIPVDTNICPFDPGTLLESYKALLILIEL